MSFLFFESYIIDRESMWKLPFVRYLDIFCLDGAYSITKEKIFPFVPTFFSGAVKEHSNRFEISLILCDMHVRNTLQ